MHHRRQRRRHGKRHAKSFSKRQVSAIKRIAAEPVETKHYTESRGFTASWTPGSFASALGTGAQFNIFASIPRGDSTTAPTRSTIEGNEFHTRGVAIKWIFHYPVTGTNAAARTCVVRVSVIAMNKYLTDNTTTPPNQWGIIGGADSTIFSVDDGNAALTSTRFNTDKVEVLASKKFYLCNGNPRGFFNEGKLWLPMRRKLAIATSDDPTVFTNRVGELRDKQYYCLWEMFDPDGLVATTTGENFYFNVDCTTYWKEQ